MFLADCGQRCGVSVSFAVTGVLGKPVGLAWEVVRLPVVANGAQHPTRVDSCRRFAAAEEVVEFPGESRNGAAASALTKAGGPFDALATDSGCLRREGLCHGVVVADWCPAIRRSSSRFSSSVSVAKASTNKANASGGLEVVVEP